MSILAWTFSSIGLPCPGLPLFLFDTSLCHTTYSTRSGGEFTDFTELLQVNVQDHYMAIDSPTSMDTKLSNGQLIFVSKICSCSTNCLARSLQAWGLFEAMLLTAPSEQPHKLTFSRQLIRSLNRRYIWLEILPYDALFCSKSVAFCCLFNVLDNDLFIIVLHAMKVIASAYHRFQWSAFNHKVVECPFPLATPLQDEMQLAKKILHLKWGKTSMSILSALCHKIPTSLHIPDLEAIFGLQLTIKC